MNHRNTRKGTVIRTSIVRILLSLTVVAATLALAAPAQSAPLELSRTLYLANPAPYPGASACAYRSPFLYEGVYWMTNYVTDASGIIVSGSYRAVKERIQSGDAYYKWSTCLIPQSYGGYYQASKVTSPFGWTDAFLNGYGFRLPRSGTYTMRTFLSWVSR